MHWNIWDSGSFKTADKILGVPQVLGSQSLRTYGTLAALSKGHFGPIEADQKRDADVDGGGPGAAEVRLQHGLDHPVAAEGSEEVDEGKDHHEGLQEGPEPGIQSDRNDNLIISAVVFVWLFRISTDTTRISSAAWTNCNQERENCRLPN